MKSSEPFALAAIWENWQRPGTEEWMRSFAVVTCAANELLAEIHDRMPVIVPPESYDRWLSNIEPDPRELLVPFSSDPMTKWPVGTRVNKPDNDDAANPRRKSLAGCGRILGHPSSERRRAPAIRQDALGPGGKRAAAAEWRVALHRQEHD